MGGGRGDRLAVPTGDDDVESGVVAQHRALVFAQTREMLDLVERELLLVAMPEVSYLRLDGLPSN